jgi:hypothetical protein
LDATELDRLRRRVGCGRKHANLRDDHDGEERQAIDPTWHSGPPES